MEIRRLHNLLRTLIELEETGEPLVSAYLDLEDPDGPRTLRERAQIARKALPDRERAAFDRALARVDEHVPWRLDPSTRAAAVFARSGDDPLFLVLEFRASLPTRLFVDSTPVIFPLVELLDNFHRYVLMICTEDSARILEVSLGTVTRELWRRRPALRERVGREWTRLHYQNHRRDRADRFVKEKVALLERIVERHAHTHLVLAGNPRVLARVRRALPRGLADKLVETVPASSRDRSSDVVLATLSTFVEHEERESLAAVDLLRQELRRGGLAVAGHRACREALEIGQADLLVVLAGRDEIETARREELVRMAVREGVHVEVVQQSDALADLGGVGCLLRFPSWAGPADDARSEVA